MSTNARIGMYVKATDGVRSIYLHWDGYPEPPGAGQTLLAHYTDPEKVAALIELGNLSSLGSEIGESVENRRLTELGHFSKRFEAVRDGKPLPDELPWQNWCHAYGRDDRLPNEEPRNHSNAEWPDDYGYIEWEYLFTPSSRSWVGREVTWSEEQGNKRGPWLPLGKLVENERKRVEEMR